MSTAGVGAVDKDAAFGAIAAAARGPIPNLTVTMASEPDAGPSHGGTMANPEKQLYTLGVREDACARRTTASIRSDKVARNQLPGLLVAAASSRGIRRHATPTRLRTAASGRTERMTEDDLRTATAVADELAWNPVVDSSVGAVSMVNGPSRAATPAMSGTGYAGLAS